MTATSNVCLFALGEDGAPEMVAMRRKRVVVMVKVFMVDLWRICDESWSEEENYGEEVVEEEG